MLGPLRSAIVLLRLSLRYAECRDRYSAEILADTYSTDPEIVPLLAQLFQAATRPYQTLPLRTLKSIRVETMAPKDRDLAHNPRNPMAGSESASKAGLHYPLGHFED